MSLFLTLLLVSGFCLSISSISNSVSDGDRFSNGSLVEASCPLNFDVLRRLMNEGPSRPVIKDMQAQCQSILQDIRLVRSEYLRTNGYFLPPPDTSAACWEAYRSLVEEFGQSFDVKTACGYHPEWISEACINVTSRAQFESLIPETKLLEIRHHCNQSLENRFACGSCTSKLLSLPEFYLQDSGNGNISDCSGYPSMYAAGVINQFGPSDRATASCLFFIRFYSEPSRVNQHKFVICGVVLGSIIGILGALSAVWFIWIRTRRSKMERNISINKEEISPKDDASLVLGSGSRGTNLVKFKIEEIKSATMNFSRKNIIGKGGYGNVYRGTLPDGTEVAFKRFKNCSEIGAANFKHEVEIIASVKHVNLVTLRGYCTTTIPMEGHQRIIVCDLLHNGSLYDHLFGPGMKKLSWPIRQKIALGTARGLAYLHYGVQPAIIHRDIKSSNILSSQRLQIRLCKVQSWWNDSFDNKGSRNSRICLSGVCIIWKTNR